MEEPIKVEACLKILEYLEKCKAKDHKKEFFCDDLKNFYKRKCTYQY